MLTRTKVLSLTIAVLLVLTLAPDAPFGYAVGEPLGRLKTAPVKPQGRPTTAARTRTGRIETDTFDSATNDPPNPAHPLFSAGAQTSGGLLIAVPQERLEALLAERGVAEAAHIGEFTVPGPGRIAIRRGRD